MTISIGATVSSDVDSSTNNLLVGHTVDVGTDALIVVVGIRDNSAAASVVSSVNWRGVQSLSSCRARIGSTFWIHFWILDSPTVASGNVEIWTVGGVDEIAATAINLNSTINTVGYADSEVYIQSDYDANVYVGAVGGAPEIGIGAVIAYGGPSNVAPSPGYGDELSEEDITYGFNVASDDNGSGCDLRWDLTSAGSFYVLACTFSENPDPSPSSSPSATPSSTPSASPSGTPSTSPSASPSSTPSFSPSSSPSATASQSPSSSPSSSPSPSESPSGSPSASPSPPVEDMLELIKTEELAFNRTAVFDHGWNAIDFLRDRYLAPGDSDNYTVDLTFTYNAGNINSIDVAGGDGDGEEGLELKVIVYGVAI